MMLTDRQAAFVASFLTRGPGWLCATRAARVAGYAWPGKQVPRLLTFPHVRAIVEERFQAVLEAERRPQPAPRGRRKARRRM